MALQNKVGQPVVALKPMKTTLGTTPKPWANCLSRREGDEWLCPTCALRWDVGDDRPDCPRKPSDDFVRSTLAAQPIKGTRTLEFRFDPIMHLDEPYAAGVFRAIEIKQDGWTVCFMSVPASEGDNGKTILHLDKCEYFTAVNHGS